MKSIRFWITLLVLALLVVVFLGLNFHAAVSNTQVGSNSGTARSGDSLPDAVRQREPVTLAITGEGLLVRALQQAIETELSAAGLGKIEFVPELDAVYDHPVMRIDVGRPEVFWTPVYATSQFPVQAGYASNGDTAQLSGPPHVFNTENGPTVVRTAEYQVSDRSWGLLSRSGYYQILAQALARRIGETMKDLYLGS